MFKFVSALLIALSSFSGAHANGVAVGARVPFRVGFGHSYGGAVLASPFVPTYSYRVFAPAVYAVPAVYSAPACVPAAAPVAAPCDAGVMAAPAAYAAPIVQQPAYSYGAVAFAPSYSAVRVFQVRRVHHHARAAVVAAPVIARQRIVVRQPVVRQRVRVGVGASIGY